MCGDLILILLSDVARVELIKQNKVWEIEFDSESTFLKIYFFYCFTLSAGVCGVCGGGWSVWCVWLECVVCVAGVCGMCVLVHNMPVPQARRASQISMLSSLPGFLSQNSFVFP